MADDKNTRALSGQEGFTDEEKRVLSPFVSNFDKPIFVLTNLPEALKGALFSRYSRSSKTLRQLLLTEFIGNKDMGFDEMVDYDTAQGETMEAATKKAEKFYERILDGYGDDSVGELGGAHVACEDVSNVASKFLEDGRIGGSPLEKSTRYVYFNFKAGGDYMFYQDPRVMDSAHKDRYLATCRNLFDVYSQLMEPAKAYVEERFPMETFQYFDMATKTEIPFTELSPEKQERAAKAYKASLRANACDILRGLLPAAARTNVGMYGNGRFFQELLSKLYSNELTEMRDLAGMMHEELNHLIPSFIRRAKANEYLVETKQSMRELAGDVMGGATVAPSKSVTLIDYDPEGEDKVVAQMLYAVTRYPIAQLRARVRTMSHEEKERIIKEYVGRRRHRRDKPGRALENTFYLFDILADYGAYRDLQRHRMLSQERQELSTAHGYDVPPEIIDAGLEKPFRAALDEAHDTYQAMYADLPREAQYVVPLQYRIRWYFHLNARAAAHTIELRSMPQGHPDYRRVVQLMYKEIERVHPLIGKYMAFVNMDEYHLGRLASEMRTEEKRAARNAA